MSKFALVATVIVLHALPTTAEDALNEDTRLSAEVTERIADLRAYGDRFGEAIRLIEAEARKPEWRWGPSGGKRTGSRFELSEN